MRPIVHRGRAATNELGVLAGFEQLDPELTLSADGPFASPFGPTVRDGRLDTEDHPRDGPAVAAGRGARALRCRAGRADRDPLSVTFRAPGRAPHGTTGGRR